MVVALILSGCTSPRPGDASRLPVPTAPVATESLAAPAVAADPAGSVAIPHRTPENPAEEAYAAWVDALRQRDAETACSLQHPERTIELREEAILLDRAELGDPCVDVEALLWEDLDRGYDISNFETTRQTDEKATLAVAFADSPTEVTVQLLFQRGAWRVRSEQPRSDEATEADTERWVAAWCDLDYTSSLEEIVAAMGPPSGFYTVDDGGDPQLYWTSNQYDFRVFYDPGFDEILDLIGDYDALSAEDLAQLDCPELR